MFIICTLDEAYNLPDSLFNKFHDGKDVLKRYPRQGTYLVVTIYGERYYTDIVAKGYEPRGVGVYDYSEREAQDKLMEIMLCG